MLLPQVDYYDIDYTDKYGKKKEATVVAAYDNEAEARQARAGLKVVGCEVYADAGGKLYRVICEQTTMTSDAKDAL
jgi:hypothetical protein